MSKRLYRSESDRMLGGVCGGIGEVYDIDPVLVRLVVVLLVFSGVSPILYLIAWLIIPTESELEESSGQVAENEVEDQSGGKEEEDENFACEECGKEFESQHGLEVHRGQKH